MFGSDCINHPPSHRKSRHAGHLSYQATILPKVETKSRSKRSTKLTEGEKWRRRHDNCISSLGSRFTRRDTCCGISWIDSLDKIRWWKSYYALSALSACIADTPCIDVFVDGHLERHHGDLHRSTSGLCCLLKPYFAECDDFGTVHAYLRQCRGDAAVEVELCRRKVLDRKMREEALVNKVIISPLLPPRRVWDLYSNRVVPWWVARTTPWAISHAWMEEKDRKSVLTPINGRKWPVPIPKDTDLDLIRNELLKLGAEYVWLDVLCLRQAGGEEEYKRASEWEVDVPTIGRVYEMAERVVYYFCGLGRPLRVEELNLESDRSWFRRAWTLQEVSKYAIIGGVDTPCQRLSYGTLSDLQCAGTNPNAIDKAKAYATMPVKFRVQLLSLEKIAQRVSEQTNVFAILSQMRDRESTNPRDKIAGLAYLLHPKIIPAYYEAQSEEDSWTALVNVISHDYKAPMLFLYPEPGNGNEIWRPSWRQIMENESLPYHNPRLLYDNVSWNPKTITHSYKAQIIESVLVQGLDREGKRGKSRRGELVVRDRSTGTDHRFMIVTAHPYPIEEGSYTILSNLNGGFHSEDLRYWVCGQRLPGPKNMFKKVSVFQMPYFSDAEKLRTLQIVEISRVVLA